MDLHKIIQTNYHINPLNIQQVTDKSYYIEDHQNKYLFKKSSLNEKSLMMWKHVLETAHKKELRTILPVYLTQSSDFFITINESIYYLSPWTTNKERNIERIYQSIGQIHSKTKIPHFVKVEQFKESFIKFKQACLRREKMLLTYIEKFERNIYMSPFELLVCTQYRDLEFICKKIVEQIERLIDDNDDRELIEWSSCLCHGQLNFSHVLQARQTYFINWEKASYNHASVDLIHLFKTEVNDYDSPEDDLLNFFLKYMHENQLTYDELIFISIHLLDPTGYLKLVDQYVRESSVDSMIIQVQKAQKMYRQLLFGLKFTNLIETDVELNLDDEEEEID